MFFELAQIRVNANIISAMYYKEILLLLSDNYQLYYIDHDYKMRRKVELLKDKEPLHPFSHASAFSSSSFTLLLPFEKKPFALLLNVGKSVELKERIDTPLKTIECMAFSPQGNYFAIGDASGRTNVFDAKSANYVTSLIPRPDYINVLEFSPNERFLVSSAYDKSVIIFDLTLNIVVATLSSSDVVECAVFYDNSESVALIQRNGAVSFYQIHERRQSAEVNLFVSWPTCGLLYHDEKHILVGMKNGGVCALEIESQSVVFTHKMASEGIAVLRFYNDELLIAGKKMQPVIIDVYHKTALFEEALNAKDFDQVSHLLKENLFLMLHPSYNAEMISFYEPIFTQIYKLIEQGAVDQAEHLVTEHADDPKIRDYFTILSNGQDHIRQLAKLIQSKSYPDAFSMVEKYSYLKSSAAAAQLERIWLKAFNQAKALSQKGDGVSVRDAKKLLEPFIKVPSKQQIAFNLMKNITVFTKADELIREKKIKEYLVWVERYPFLKEQETYEKVKAIGERYLQQLKAVTQENAFEKAKEYLAFLTPFYELQKSVEVIKHELVSRIHFFKAVEVKDWNRVYALAKEYPQLRQLKAYEKIEKNFNHVMKESLDIAFKGDGKALAVFFDPYKEIELFKDKIASMYKISYLNEMKKADNAQVDWAKTYQQFINLFGKSDELIHTAKIIGNVDEVLAVKSDNDAQGYKKYPLIETIIVLRS